MLSQNLMHTLGKPRRASWTLQVVLRLLEISPQRIADSVHLMKLVYLSLLPMTPRPEWTGLEHEHKMGPATSGL